MPRPRCGLVPMHIKSGLLKMAEVVFAYSPGFVYMWLMEDVNLVDAGSPGGISTDWRIEGVGDFNGDDKADILWRYSSRLVYIWLVSGANLIGSGSPGNMGPDWAVQYAADFNGTARRASFGGTTAASWGSGSSTGPRPSAAVRRGASVWIGQSSGRPRKLPALPDLEKPQDRIPPRDAGRRLAGETRTCAALNGIWCEQLNRPAARRK